MRLETIIGGVVLIALAAAGFAYVFGVLGTPPLSRTEFSTATLTPEEKEGRYPRAPELVTPDGYINTPRLSSGQAGPITIAEFKGKKAVLIDFWTYSCINCQRTLPYLRMWNEKYKDEGLVIIGVHTPEFAFEQVKANVENAAREFGLTYPIVQDNEYQTWNAFGNQFWPRKYLIDIDGYIVYDHAGEGKYAETEAAIQKALAERASRLNLDPPTSAVSETPKDTMPIESGKVRSPEVYFGAARNEYLGNGTQFKTGVQTLTLPKTSIPNVLYLGGTWEFTDEYTKSASSGTKIKYTYSAKNVYFVARADTPVKVKLVLDGRPIGASRGADVDEKGYVTIQEDRLYKLVEGEGYGEHILEMEIEGVGLQAYTFTFG